MENAFIRVQTLKVDTNRQLLEHYKYKIQFKEQLEDNEWKLHFCRGVIQSLVEAEDYLSDGDSVQALMRLQTRRVEVHKELSENFQAKVLLGQQVNKLKSQVIYLKGQLDAGKDVGQQLGECTAKLSDLQEIAQQNEEELHFRRGVTASEDEIERILNESVNPETVQGRVETSPGSVGPNFTGQAMQKPDKVEFPDNAPEDTVYPEYDAGDNQHVPLKEVLW